MSNTEDISKMDFKALKEKVQELEDTIAKLKRTYEDAIYNLDEDNFGKNFTLQQKNMKAQIKMTADAIKSTVSKTDLDTKLEDYSTIEQTAGAITSTVQKQADIKNAEIISDLSEATDTSRIYKIQTYGENNKVTGEKYYYYNSLSKSWEILSGDTIYTMFEQTDEGFVLRGNTIIDGKTTITRDLKLQGKVTWDMENSPVLTQYSTDGASDDESWHSPMESTDMYMRMSFDGGKTWSSPTKVVGTDGTNGTNGTDANVTPEKVFDILTNKGAGKGIFPAFYNNENHLYISADYIKSGIVSANRIDVNNLSCTRVRAKDAEEGNSAYFAVGVYDESGEFKTTAGFGMYMSQVKDLEFKKFSPKGTDCAFGVLNESENDGSCDAINIYSFGNAWLGVNKTTETVYPKGKWDFTNCTITGLSSSPVGTAKAVFC